MRTFPFAPFLALALLAPSVAFAQTQTLVVDDFEGDLASWTRNDKNKVGLSDIVKTAPGAAAGSKNSALITFKTGQNSWASVSRAVDGAAWARSNAGRLSFWLNGSGDEKGVTLQLRGKVEQADVVYSLPQDVRLNVTNWRQVVIPLSQFKGSKGETLGGANLRGVYLLQFSQAGNWNSRFFGIDDIAVSALPVAARPTPTPRPTATAAPAATNSVAGAVAGNSIAVNADFKRSIGTIRAAVNPTITVPFAEGAAPALENASFRSYTFNSLRPRFARIEASGFVDLTDSSKPTFSYARLLAAARRVRAARAEPVVALPNSRDWGLSPSGYASFVAGAVRALNAAKGPAVRYYDLQTWSDDISPSAALAFYNAGFGAAKGVLRGAIVGGYGAPAGDATSQNALLNGARGLDFLGVSFYGALRGAPSNEAMFEAARTISGLKTAAGLLDKSRFRRAALFVTSANVSGARNPGDFVPSDIRTIEPFAGAWWSQFMISSSRLADQVFHSDSVNAEWGFLDKDARAYPAFYAAYHWNTYFPSGSTRVFAQSANPAIAVAACNTATAHNLLLINTSNAEQTAQISIRGFPVLRTARARFLGEMDSTVLKTSPFQTIKLRPFGVAVVQFIEPPKKR